MAVVDAVCLEDFVRDVVVVVTVAVVVRAVGVGGGPSGSTAVVVTTAVSLSVSECCEWRGLGRLVSSSGRMEGLFEVDLLCGGLLSGMVGVEKEGDGEEGSVRNGGE